MMDSVLKVATAMMAQYMTSLESVWPPQNALVSSSVPQGSMWFRFFEVWNFSGHLGFNHDYRMLCVQVMYVVSPCIVHCYAAKTNGTH